jgi:hypothetical protein
MASKQAVGFADCLAEIGRRSSNPNFELETIRDGQHSFIMGAGRVDEVDRAIGEMCIWLRSTLGLQTAVA